MRFIILLALIGSALSLQGQVEYMYTYKARIGTGVQSSRPQYAATGLVADVKVMETSPDEVTVQIMNPHVGEKNQVLGNNGRDEMPIEYHKLQDPLLVQPFKAFLKRHDGEIVMQVPSTDSIWITNLRRGIANFLRTAPIVDPTSVKTSQSGGEVEPQGFSRIEDTYAGRCKVGYTVTPATIYDTQFLNITEDIQSQDAKKGPAGCSIKLDPNRYRVVSAIDFSTCSDRVGLHQSGVGNLTNITSSTYRDVTARSHVSQYILQGSPGKFRIQTGIIESEFIMNPYGIETDKIIVISNQTMHLKAARPLARVERSLGKTRDVQTWSHQVQSPFRPAQHGHNPRFVQYKQSGQATDPAVFYEQLTTGQDWPRHVSEDSMKRVVDGLHLVNQLLNQQNADRTKSPADYRGTEDGRAAQILHDCQRIVRTLNYDDLINIYNQLDTKPHTDESPSNTCLGLYVETLGVAGSGPSVQLLVEKIRNNKVSENRTASIFFNLANNIRSPEVVSSLVDYVMSIKEEEHVLVGLLTKLNTAIIIRRLCVHEEIMTFSHMRYAYGEKMCDKQSTVSKFLAHLEQRIEGDHPTWVKILNVFAAADLGAPESLKILKKVATGQVSQDKFMRYAAIHEMSFDSFDNTSRDQVFDILQPIAENQMEDYRVRQIAYNTLLSYTPNVTFLQRMVLSSNNEPSMQMQSFYYWVIDSIARVDDEAHRPLTNAARNLLPITRYMNPSIRRSMSYISSRYFRDDLVGATGQTIWLSQFREYFPREVYSYVSGKYGRFTIPLLETVTFTNTQALTSKIRSLVEGFQKPARASNSQTHDRRRHIQQQIQNMKSFSSGSSSSNSASNKEPAFYQYTKMFGTSQVFLPLTDELYSEIKSSMSKMMGKTGEEEVVMHKFMSPIDISVLMPTPMGIWFNTEVSSPTVMYAKVRIQSKNSFAGNSDDLPALTRLNIVAEGIAKIVTKCNSYTYVFAPWSNKTVFAAVDNEKSASMPMKYELAADLDMPANELWGKITPKFTGNKPVPVLKYRTVPFTAIGGVLPSTESGESLQFQKASWQPKSCQQMDVRIPISKKYTGINAEIHYTGEPDCPLTQPDFYHHLYEPSRLMSLLASPSIKPFELTVYRTDGNSDTASFGFGIRHIMQTGNPSSGKIDVPASAKQPVDILVGDSLQQREAKIQKFSNQENHEYSMRLNFTGKATKKYEMSLIMAQEQRAGSSPNTKSAYNKLQWSLLQQNAELQNKPATCMVGVADRPMLQPMTTAQEMHAAHQSINAPASASIYEGNTCSPTAQPLAEATAKLTVSDNRIKEIMEVSNGDEFRYNDTSEFYRLAVYDKLDLQVHWQPASTQMQNFTYRAQDMAEGFLFPKIVKNYMAPNPEHKMTISAKRSISDDRVDAWVSIPVATCHAEKITIHPWFDQLTGYTTNVYPSQQTSRLSQQSLPNGQCVIHPSQVKTFDGVSYKKPLTNSETTVTKAQAGEETIVVTAKMASRSNLSEVKILSAGDAVEVIVMGQDVEINGKRIPQSEQSSNIRDEAANIVGKVIRNPNSVEVTIEKKVVVFVKDGNKIMIKLDERFMKKAQGLCGDFNSEHQDDLRSSKGCVFSRYEGAMFQAACLADEQQYSEPAMRQLVQQVRQHESSCSKGSSAVTARGNCGFEGYPIYVDGDNICVSETKQRVCQSICRKGQTEEKRLRSKCWKRSSAPSLVSSSISKGYLSTPAKASAGMEETTKTFSLPASCNNPLTYGRQQVSSAEDCYVQGYPVLREGVMLCVSETRASMCKPECSRVSDAIPHMEMARCWKSIEAPEQVKQGEKIGYCSTLDENPYMKELMAFEVPKNCHKPGN